jgi:hypothetical protein
VSGVKIDVIGAATAVREIRLRGERSRSARPAMKAIAKVARDSEKRQFSSGQGWPPIKAKSRARKMRRGLDPRVMRATGLLEKVLTQPGQHMHGQMEDAGPDGLVFGIRPGRSDVFYAYTHAKRKWKLIRFDSIAERDAADIMARWINEGHV